MNDPAVLKVKSLLSRLIDLNDPTNPKTSIIYSSIEAQITLITRVWLSLPGKGNTLAPDDPEQALEDLINFGTISDLKDMVDAIGVINKAYSAYTSDELRRFIDLVGSETITKKEILEVFDVRYKEEIAEQNNLFKQANDLKEKVTAIAASLNIPLIPISTQPVVQTEDPRKKMSFLQRMVMVPDKSKNDNISQADLFADASWKTPPVIDDSFVHDVAKVQRIWDFLFVEKADPAIVLNNLVVSHGYDDDKLKDLTGRMVDLSSRQISQSRAILTNIEKDYKLYHSCLEAVMELQMILIDIGNFFKISVAADSSKPSKPSK